MAFQEWIMMRKDLYRDPDVLRIAQKLKTRVEHVVGYLHRVWGWLDEQCDDGHIHGITLDTVEELLSLPHFLHLMCEVGWLEYENEHITVPNWDRWMSTTAKKRLQNARRMQKKRSAQMCEKSAVSNRTPSSSSSSSKTTKKKKVSGAKKTRMKPPTLAEVEAYWNQKKFTSDFEEFWNHYEANGWKVGPNPMKKWHQAAGNWEKRNKRGEFRGGNSEEQAAIERHKRLIAAEATRREEEEAKQSRGARPRSGSGEASQLSFNIPGGDE